MGATAIPTLDSPPLLEKLAEARTSTDNLFGVVRPEAIYDRPIAERHRIIFYTGHLEAFDWNLLSPLLALKSPTPDWDRLFSFGIDPVDGQLPSDQPGDWPRPEEIAGYNRRVRETLDQSVAAFDRDPDKNENQRRELRQLLHVAIEHRLMHAETLAYMLHQLPLHRKSRPQDAATDEANLAGPAVDLSGPRMIEIPEGVATLGLPRATDGAFGWDNEFEQHSVRVPAFRIGAYPVTNRDFLRFLDEGAYEDRALWSEADWQWLESSGTTHPAFWVLRNNRWFCRTMFDEVPLPLDWPAAVSHAEASAFARWSGRELPSEEEWHRAAYGVPGDGAEREYPWGQEPPDATRGNFDFARWDSTAVGAFPAGQSAFGVMDLAGNGWEWTRTVFAPFAGFHAFPFYPGYSANFFDGQHYVMKGGSARTGASMLRRSFRNWFQPHYPFVYSAFRLVDH